MKSAMSDELTHRSEKSSMLKTNFDIIIIIFSCRFDLCQEQGLWSNDEGPSMLLFRLNLCELNEWNKSNES